jgi:hypothetical protein
VPVRSSVTGDQSHWYRVQTPSQYPKKSELTIIIGLHMWCRPESPSTKSKSLSLSLSLDPFQSLAHRGLLPISPRLSTRESPIGGHRGPLSEPWSCKWMGSLNLFIKQQAVVNQVHPLYGVYLYLYVYAYTCTFTCKTLITSFIFKFTLHNLHISPPSLRQAPCRQAVHVRLLHIYIDGDLSLSR